MAQLTYPDPALSGSFVLLDQSNSGEPSVTVRFRPDLHIGFDPEELTAEERAFLDAAAGVLVAKAKAKLEAQAAGHGDTIEWV